MLKFTLPKKWTFIIFGVLCTQLLSAQVIQFQPAEKDAGKITTSGCVLIDLKGTIATVVALGSDPEKAVLLVDGNKVPLKFLVKNIESRVALYQLPESEINKLSSVKKLSSSTAVLPAQMVYCSDDKKNHSTVLGKIFRFQGRVLPVAVFRVNHQQDAPLPGSGIYSDDGSLLALVRQPVHNKSNSSYCLPCEVITRIHKDFKKNGRATRCWIGLIMNGMETSPIIESVRPESPAAKVGIKAGDVILNIGERTVDNYEQAVDAFFYLVAGVPEKFRVLRGTEVLEFTLTPTIFPGR